MKRPTPRPTRRARGGFPRKAVAGAFFVLLLGGWALGKLPLAIAFFYAGMSVVAMLAYRRDKAAAERGQWRTQESTLHFFALAGGWPGALVAQDVFRHKSSKASFQAVFWLTVLFNCGALAWAVSSVPRP